MKTTTTMLLGLVALAMMVGCGGSDDPEQSNPPISLQCGSAELFSQSHDSCGPMDAVGVPDEEGRQCRCFIGYKWTGSSCETVDGCACVGKDCTKLTDTAQQCEQAHAACTGSTFSCGSADLFAQTHSACDAMDVKAMPDDAGDCFCMLGFAWNGSACEPLSNCRCEGADCDKLSETPEACEQAHATCSSAPTSLECGSAQLFSLKHDTCGPMNAKAVPDENGSCFCFLGYAWNGTACVGLADCACEGDDCDKLTETEEACEQAHAACAN
jgi:hypothetical protein